MQHRGPFLDPITLGKCLVRGSSEHRGFCVPKRVLVRHERAYSRRRACRRCHTRRLLIQQLVEFPLPASRNDRGAGIAGGPGV